MVTIVTESTADLSPELISKYQIKVVPLVVHINENEYQDGENIDLETLYGLVAETGKLPKTSAPAFSRLYEAFNVPGEVIYIGISSELSAANQNAFLAAKDFEDGKIFIIDSKNLSTGIGMLAVKAAELRDQGLSAEEIVSQIKSSVPKVRTSFIVDTMEYLYMGGRCTGVQNLMGSLLKIHPVIEVKSDGKLGVKNKVRGARKNALEALLKDFQYHLNDVDMHRIFVTHSGCDADGAFLAEEIKKMCAPDEVCVTRAGCVVSSHCGPNTIGILYFIK